MVVLQSVENPKAFPLAREVCMYVLSGQEVDFSQIWRRTRSLTLDSRLEDTQLTALVTVYHKVPMHEM